MVVVLYKWRVNGYRMTFQYTRHHVLFVTHSHRYTINIYKQTLVDILSSSHDKMPCAKALSNEWSVMMCAYYYSCRLASCWSWSSIPISSHSTKQSLKRMTSTLSWVGSQCVVQSACMSPLSAELAQCSLYEHIQEHKGKPDIEMSLRWAADVAKGTYKPFVTRCCRSII